MKRRVLVALGLSLGLGTSAVAGLTPAAALDSVTSYSVSPTTFRGGDDVLVTINGQTSGSYTFTGCVVYFFDGIPAFSSDYGPSTPPFEAGTMTTQILNRSGEDVQYESRAYSGLCSSVSPSDTSVWSTNATITPQLVINPVALTVGASGPVTVDYTTASPGGVSPFDWTSGYGGDFRELEPSNCDATLAPVSLADSELPAGVTISDTQSPSGSAPALVLNGTPGSDAVGTYKVCVGIADDMGETSAAWMTVTVSAAALPTTGLDSFVMAAAAGFAGLLGLTGAFFLVLRKRSTV